MKNNSNHIALPLVLKVKRNGCSDYEYNLPESTSIYSKSISSLQLESLLNESDEHCFEDGDLLVVQNSKSIRKIFSAGSKHNSLFITNNCNQECIFCPQPPIACKDYDYYYSLNTRLVQLLPKDLNTIGITGGEPTLLGDRLYELLKYINKLLPATVIQMLTNGLYFKEYSQINKLAGVDCDKLVLGIPFYSHIPSVHNRIVNAKVYFGLLDSLFNLASNNNQIELRIVINRFNYSHLYELAQFIYKNFPFVIHVAFMGMELMGYAKTNSEEVWVDTKEYINELCDTVTFLDMNNFYVSIYNLPLCLLPEEIRRFSRDSITEWKRKYDMKCEICTAKGMCAGMFNSTFEKYRYDINPI